MALLADEMSQVDDVLSVGDDIQLRGVLTCLVVTRQLVSIASSGGSCSSPNIELAADNCHLAADVRLHQAVLGVMLPDLALADGLRQGHDMDALAAVPLLLQHPQLPPLPPLLQQQMSFQWLPRRKIELLWCNPRLVCFCYYYRGPGAKLCDQLLLIAFQNDVLNSAF